MLQETPKEYISSETGVDRSACSSSIGTGSEDHPRVPAVPQKAGPSLGPI